MIEAFCVACAVVTFSASFLTAADAKAKVFRELGVLALACAYLVSASIRLGDHYKLWPGAADASSARPRTWRTRSAEYAYLFFVGILGTVIITRLVL